MPNFDTVAAANSLISMPTVSAIFGAKVRQKDFERFQPYLRKAAAINDISNLKRAVAFLTTLGFESQYFTKTAENLNYSGAGLDATFSAYKGRTIMVPQLDTAGNFVVNHLGGAAKHAIALSQYHAHDPEAIANFVYDDANRADGLKLGNIEKGDGYKFRGRGLIMITGRSEYTRLSKACGKTLDETIAWFETDEGAAMSAGYYWASHGLNMRADLGNFTKVTEVINYALAHSNAKKWAAQRADRDSAYSFGIWRLESGGQVKPLSFDSYDPRGNPKISARMG